MEDCSISSNFSLYLFLVVSVILVSVDAIGIYHIVLTWQQSIHLPSNIFNSCLKWQLITRTCFASFSTFAAISSFILCGFLIINTEFFVEKALSTFLYYNYMIFGPYMLGFCILGLVFWQDITYVCIRSSSNYKFFSSSNAFSLIFSLVISVVITIGVSVYKAMNLYVDSVLQKPEGYDFIRKFVLWIALRNSSASELLRNHNNNSLSNNNEVIREEDEFSRIRIGD